MSFFDNNNNVGLALIIVGLIAIVAGILHPVLDEEKGAAVAYGIAGIISGIIFLLYGLKVRSGSNDKVAIVSGLLRAVGIATILQAIFVAVGYYLLNDEISGAVGVLVVQIIIGLIFLWISGKVAGANKNIISKILWVLLVIFSLIAAIFSLLGAISSDVTAIISGIAWFIVYIYVFLASLSGEVKSAMGI
ncbi:MAG: hypothetical protein LBT41_01800 [Candidatus Methanoplasma sp.]|jgi:hypothetical protein|nr:hypothetical protein [Candidatus Methanoplasma sp.]